MNNVKGVTWSLYFERTSVLVYFNLSDSKKLSDSYLYLNRGIKFYVIFIVIVVDLLLSSI